MALGLAYIHRWVPPAFLKPMGICHDGEARAPGHILQRPACRQPCSKEHHECQECQLFIAFVHSDNDLGALSNPPFQ